MSAAARKAQADREMADLLAARDTRALGHLAPHRPATAADIVPGAVLRLSFTDGSAAGFSDSVVIEVRDGEVSLLRPFATVDAAGRFVLAEERIKTSLSRLVASPHWLLICGLSGRPEAVK